MVFEAKGLSILELQTSFDIKFNIRLFYPLVTRRSTSVEVPRGFHCGGFYYFTPSPISVKITIKQQTIIPLAWHRAEGEIPLGAVIAELTRKGHDRGLESSNVAGGLLPPCGSEYSVQEYPWKLDPGILNTYKSRESDAHIPASIILRSVFPHNVILGMATKVQDRNLGKNLRARVIISRRSSTTSLCASEVQVNSSRWTKSVAPGMSEAKFSMALTAVPFSDQHSSVESLLTRACGVKRRWKPAANRDPEQGSKPTGTASRIDSLIAAGSKLVLSGFQSFHAGQFSHLLLVPTCHYVRRAAPQECLPKTFAQL